MKLRHVAILGGWSVAVMIVTGILLLPLIGDCFGDPSCERNSNVYFWSVVGPAFVIYWLVFIGLIRRWSR